MRAVDVLLALPRIMLAMALIDVLGRSQAAALVAVGLTGIPGFELAEGFAVERLDPDLGRKRLVGPQRLRAPPQDEVADRAPVEVLDLLDHAGADADAGPELLVGRFQPGRRVDGVAVRRLL